MNEQGTPNGTRSLNEGVWFRSSVSGLWYENHKAAGDISEVAVDGVRYPAPETLQRKWRLAKAKGTP